MPKYTAAHWGTYRIDGQELFPLSCDTDPSRIGRGWVSAVQNRDSRIRYPAVRRGWLAGDKGAQRCRDRFVRVGWDQAIALAAGELNRVRRTVGNGAIFAGSYGWASAGRFHHAQSQLKRFMNLAGGYVGARNTYSHGAAEVLWPHIIGLTQRAFQDSSPSWSLIAEHCTLLVAFGGLSRRTAQICASGTTEHEVSGWLQKLKARLVSVSPHHEGTVESEWLSIRPGTDTALILALCHSLLVTNRHDEQFLNRCTSGWPQFRAYLRGETDGVEKSADWAAPLCDCPAQTIRDLARDMAQARTMITISWSLQRADHGEQPLWAATALASMLGQIGQPGTGFGFGYSSVTPIGRPARIYRWPALPQGDNPVKDFIPVARLADMLAHPGGSYRYNGQVRVFPDIRLIYWAGGNPFHHHQDLNRLEKLWVRPETVIVNEHSWTATARRADIVLPATTPLERDDMMMNRREAKIVYMSQMFPPLGEALDDFEIFRRLADALDFERAFTAGHSVTDWLRHLWQEAQNSGAELGVTLPDFDSFRAAGQFEMPDSATSFIPFADFVADPTRHPLKTESGRITLFSHTIAGFDLNDCPGHPVWQEPAESLLHAPAEALHLISGQPDTRLHAQNDSGCESQNDKIAGCEPCFLHPQTAAARQITAGQIIRIWNARGACLAGVRFDEKIRPDCIALATGAWFDPVDCFETPLEISGNPNVLTRDQGCSSLSQGTMAHSALVFVAPWPHPIPERRAYNPTIGHL